MCTHQNRLDEANLMRTNNIHSYYRQWPGDMINTTLCLCFTAQKECCAQPVLIPFMSAGLALNENIRGNSKNKYIYIIKRCFLYGSAAQNGLTAHHQGFG